MLKLPAALKMGQLFLTVFLLTLLPTTVLAHSGRTDSSGGHNCYVGACAGTYHYHSRGGYTTPYITPYSTPVISSPKPSLKPTLSPSPTPIPSPSPSPTPEVKGETTETSPSPETTVVEGDQSKDTSAGDTVLGLGILAAIIGGGFWLVRKSFKKFKGQPPSQNE